MFIPPCRDMNTSWALSCAQANLMLELAVRPRRDASMNCFTLSPSFAAKWHRLLCYGVALAASGCYHEWTMCTSQGPYLSSGCFSAGQGVHYRTQSDALDDIHAEAALLERCLMCLIFYCGNMVRVRITTRTTLVRQTCMPQCDLHGSPCCVVCIFLPLC